MVFFKVDRVGVALIQEWKVLDAISVTVINLAITRVAALEDPTDRLASISSESSSS